ncbi:MAG: reprolysin-like metallopeptidase [Armatimonadota bacterium]
MKLGIKAIQLVFGVLLLSTAAMAQRPVAPALNSNPGARYTVFLNFTGFNYNGTWAGKTPGNVPAYTTDADATTFTTGEINNIREIWARTSQKYIGMNINVTTVDPAPTGLTDAQRQTWYDNKQYMTHAMIGGSNAWYGAAGGVSYVGVAKSATLTSGQRTNWTFPAGGSGTSPQSCTAACAHEIGHHLGLSHQKDESNGAAYSNNNGATGNGSYAPLMGTSYVSQRGTWRQGATSGTTTNANDVAVLMSQLNMGAPLDSGWGHTMGTASIMPVNSDGTVNTALSKGWIMPKASTGYSAVGEASYTTDWFKFGSLGGAVSLTANDGTSFLQNGVADPGATMRSVLRIFSSTGALVGTAIEDATTLKRTWSGNLAFGEYYAQVASYGDYISPYEPNSRYFNMGGYFLSGTGLAPVPEPATMIGLAVGLGALARRRRKK